MTIETLQVCEAGASAAAHAAPEPPDAWAVQPFLVPRRGDIWDECRERAVRYEAALREELDRVSLGAEVSVSPPGHYPAVVRCDLWIPDASLPAGTRRCFATIALTPQPQRCKPLQWDASCSRGSRTWRRSGRGMGWEDLPDASRIAKEVVAFFFDARARAVPPEPFRSNRMEDFLAALFARNRWIGIHHGLTVGQILLAIGMLIPFVVPFILAGLWLNGLGRRTVVLDSGRPAAKPRQLDFMDSWQKVLPGLAAERDEVVADLMAAGAGMALDAPPAQETIAHAGSNGLERRKQVVFKLRRAEVFAHVQAYGNDLYVGWDAHLNRAYWKEVPMHEGRESMGERHARLSTVVVDHLRFTEYDLADVNMVSGQLHRHLRRIVERLVREHHIDFDIDFAPLRRDRDDVLRRHAAPDAARGTVSRTLWRTA